MNNEQMLERCVLRVDMYACQMLAAALAKSAQLHG